MTAFTITVQWEMVPCTAQNGEIIGYIVYYWETEHGNENDFTNNITVNGEVSHGDTINDEERKNMCMGSGYAPDMMSTTQSTGSEADITASGQEVTLIGLIPSTNYSISIATYNRAGIGQPSQPLLLETNSEFP